MLEHVDDHAIDVWADNLEQIEGERVSSALVRMKDTHSRVQAHGEGGEPALRLSDGIQVREQRVAGSDGEARARCER